MKKQSNLYYILYVKNCENLIKKFKTKAAMHKFIEKFEIRNEDDWIDCIFYGKMLAYSICERQK